MSPAPDTSTVFDLWENAFREARACFHRNDVDVSVTRDVDEREERRYVARVHTFGDVDPSAKAFGETPEDALEELTREIVKLALRFNRELDACDAANDRELAERRGV